MGQPKGELSLQGVPLLAYLLNRLHWGGPTLLVTTPGREHPPGHELFNAEAVDEVAAQGPLRGILTAIEHARTDIILTLTVDMPVISTPQLNALVLSLAEQPEKQIVMYQRNVKGEEWVEPFPSIYRKSADPVIAEQLGLGNRSVRRLTRLSTTALISAPTEWPEQTWTNLNEPSDLQAFLRTM